MVFWKCSFRIWLYAVVIASHNSTLVGCISKIQISLSPMSKRCSMELRSGEHRDHFSTGNSLLLPWTNLPLFLICDMVHCPATWGWMHHWLATIPRYAVAFKWSFIETKGLVYAKKIFFILHYHHQPDPLIQVG